MFCTHCGKKIDDDSNYCIYCGKNQNSDPNDMTGRIGPEKGPGQKNNTGLIIGICAGVVVVGAVAVILTSSLRSRNDSNTDGNAAEEKTEGIPDAVYIPEATSRPALTPEPAPEPGVDPPPAAPAEPAPAVPEGNESSPPATAALTDWQIAYYNYLLNPPARELTTSESGPDRYSLYDIDKNGIPELFIFYYGMAEIDRQCDVFTSYFGFMEQIDTLPDMLTSGYYGCPEENGFLTVFEGTDAVSVDRYSLVDGILIRENLLWWTMYDETPYPDPYQFVISQESFPVYEISNISPILEAWDGGTEGPALAFSEYEGSPAASQQVYFTFANASSTLFDGAIDYLPGYAIDGDLNTSWVEGAKGHGIGEFLVLEFDHTQEIDLLSLRLGYVHNVNRDNYLANNRPSKLKFEFSDGSSVEYSFKDVNEEHFIQLNRPVHTSFVILTIEDVYLGTVDDDTCITEVRAYYTR